MYCTEQSEQERAGGKMMASLDGVSGWRLWMASGGMRYGTGKKESERKEGVEEEK